MSNCSRDITVLLNMRKYCRYVAENISKLTNGLEEFKNTPLYKDSISMEIHQIGELAKDLSEEFINKTNSEISFILQKDIRIIKDK